MHADGQHYVPDALLPVKNPNTNVTERWTGLKGSLDDLQLREKSLTFAFIGTPDLQPGASHCGLVWTERDTSTQLHVMRMLKKMSSNPPAEHILADFAA